MFDQFIIEVDTREPMQRLHETIRQWIEEACEHYWRVTDIKGTSVTSYGTTLASRTQDHPDYILTQVLVEFAIYAVENGPVETIVEGVPFDIRRAKICFQALLMSNGELRVIFHQIIF